MNTMKNTFRHNDTMIAVESCPAEIAFDDILAATSAFPDHDNIETPWENCDGFEHVTHPARSVPHACQRQGYCGDVIITLPPGDPYGYYEYARKGGASRQVAAELQAANHRQILAQLVKWYLDGWEWYGVRCKMEVLGTEYEASVYGIDDLDYANGEVQVEIASEVAAQLTAAGFIVTGIPEVERWSRENKRDHLRRHLTLQNWAA